MFFKEKNYTTKTGSLRVLIVFLPGWILMFSRVFSRLKINLYIIFISLVFWYMSTVVVAKGE